MKNKFDFYELVEIIGLGKELDEVRGKKAVVVGMSENEDTNEWGYAVDINGCDDGWDVMEKDLLSMGKFIKRDNMYSEETIRVRVDPKTGEGDIVDDED